jgi:hypothetical protein
MNEKTQQDYRKLAANFYKKRLDGQSPTPKKIADALKQAASEYRPAYWRRLRNALAFDQSEKGFLDAANRINSTKNPVTKEGSEAEIKPKQPRSKRISEKDEVALMKHFTEMNDPVTTAAMFVAKYTGARPSEMSQMLIVDGKVFIPGAKKNEAGDRGADRVVELPPAVVSAISKALPYLQGDIGPTQDKIRNAAKKLWPQRKSVPTLYSWRHQLGADLKASGLDRRSIAYVMGHQSTESVDRYGNSRTARGGKVLPKPAAEADLSKVRETHGKPPMAADAAMANARQSLRDDSSPAARAAALLNAEGLKTGNVRDVLAKSQKKQEVGKSGGLDYD